MTRWVMVVDLDRCTGCQTCSVACKVEHALGPGLQRVSVVEKETGTYPNVQRIYVPRRCMNCADPACVGVCPSGATKKRDDGVVTIDQDQCIGCRYCLMACPFNARTFHGEQQSYHAQPSNWEQRRYPEHTVGVVDKCDFCRARIDAGIAAGLTPGADTDATPMCVISCIAAALTFGDLDEPDSEVSRLIREREGVQLMPDMETDPSVFYLSRRLAREAGPD
jgi:phenylacetyl-CoA:acceptor oxidoreductase subunit 1